MPCPRVIRANARTTADNVEGVDCDDDRGHPFPTPDEIEGFWAFDKMHAPRPLHPLSQDLVMSTLAVGFTKAQAEYDSPVVASNQAINHYFFMSFHPHPDE